MDDIRYNTLQEQIYNLQNRLNDSLVKIGILESKVDNLEKENKTFITLLNEKTNTLNQIENQLLDKNNSQKQSQNQNQQSFPNTFKSQAHVHLLKKTLFQRNFVCDICKKHNIYWSFYCKACDFDMCMECYQQEFLLQSNLIPMPYI